MDDDSEISAHGYTIFTLMRLPRRAQAMRSKVSLAKRAHLRKHTSSDCHLIFYRPVIIARKPDILTSQRTPLPGELTRVPSKSTVAMAELAGLILGAIALAGPAYQCYSKCEKLFDDVSNHTRAFKSCAGTFFIQKEMFQGECEIMLSSVYSNQVAQAMLKNPTDSRWRALREMRHETAIPLKTAVSAVQRCVELTQHLLPLADESRSVEEIERKLLQVLEKVNKKENVAEGLLTFREDELVPVWKFEL